MAATLQKNIDNSQTVINIQDTSTLPGNGGVITIDSETILYLHVSDTAISGCTRGFNGSSAASHTSGKPVTVISSGTPATFINGGTITPDASAEVSANGVITININATTTINGPINAVDEQKLLLRLVQDATGHTVTFATGVGNFEFGTTFTSFTASGANLIDYVGIVYNANREKWDLVSLSQGF